MPGIDAFHVDVSDGSFTPELIFNLRVIRAIAAVTTRPVEVHLMVEEPERWIMPVIRAGAMRVAFHAEATRYPLRCAAACRAAGASPTLAINPATAIEPLLYAVSEVDRVNLLSTEPDEAGEAFIDATLAKVERTAALLPNNVRLQVDGGIDSESASALVDRGAVDLVMGRALLDALSMPDLVHEITHQSPSASSAAAPLPPTTERREHNHDLA